MFFFFFCCCFVDLKKSLDSNNQNDLWCKLIKHNVSWNLFSVKIRALVYTSSVYMGILGQAFYPILPHFLPPRTTFSKPGPLFLSKKTS